MAVEREQLVGRLLRLQRAFGALAARDDARRAPGRRSRTLATIWLCTPIVWRKADIAASSRARAAADALVAAHQLVEALRVELPELRVELVDPEVDAPGLAHQRVDLLEPLLELAAAAESRSG